MSDKHKHQTYESDDPVIARVRAARRKISARFEHDPAKLVAHYMKLQEQHSDRLVSHAPEVPPKDQSAA